MPPARPRRWKPPAEEAPKISEMVARIERMRRIARTGPARDAARAVELPHVSRIADDLPALFRWECGPSGEIAWVEGAPRGALIGRSIALAGNGEGKGSTARSSAPSRCAARSAMPAFRLPATALLSGRWRISGVPAFEPADGRFAGYRGVARREEAMPPPAGSTAGAAVARP